MQRVDFHIWGALPQHIIAVHAIPWCKTLAAFDIP
jgi:hypothetical protein